MDQRSKGGNPNEGPLVPVIPVHLKRIAKRKNLRSLASVMTTSNTCYENIFLLNQPLTITTIVKRIQEGSWSPTNKLNWSKMHVPLNDEVTQHIKSNKCCQCTGKCGKRCRCSTKDSSRWFECYHSHDCENTAVRKAVFPLVYMCHTMDEEIGIGVRAGHNIKEGTVVGVYNGVVKSTLPEHDKDKYLISLDEKALKLLPNGKFPEVAIDGKPTGGMMAFINDPGDKSLVNCNFVTIYTCNCAFVVLVANKNIEEDQWLAVSYNGYFGKGIKQKRIPNDVIPECIIHLGETDYEDQFSWERPLGTTENLNVSFSKRLEKRSPYLPSVSLEKKMESLQVKSGIASMGRSMRPSYSKSMYNINRTSALSEPSGSRKRKPESECCSQEKKQMKQYKSTHELRHKINRKQNLPVPVIDKNKPLWDLEKDETGRIVLLERASLTNFFKQENSNLTVQQWNSNFVEACKELTIQAMSNRTRMLTTSEIEQGIKKISPSEMVDGLENVLKESGTIMVQRLSIPLENIPVVAQPRFQEIIGHTPTEKLATVHGTDVCFGDVATLVPDHQSSPNIMDALLGIITYQSVRDFKMKRAMLIPYSDMVGVFKRGADSSSVIAKIQRCEQPVMIIPMRGNDKSWMIAFCDQDERTIEFFHPQQPHIQIGDQDRQFVVSNLITIRKLMAKALNEKEHDWCILKNKQEWPKHAVCRLDKNIRIESGEGLKNASSGVLTIAAVESFLRRPIFMQQPKKSTTFDLRDRYAHEIFQYRTQSAPISSTSKEASHPRPSTSKQ